MDQPSWRRRLAIFTGPHGAYLAKAVARSSRNTVTLI